MLWRIGWVIKYLKTQDSYEKVTFPEILTERLHFPLYQVPTAFSEGEWAGRAQDKLLSLGWKISLKADEPQLGQRYEDVERKWITTTLLFSLERLEILPQERRGQVHTLVMERLNTILFHKSWPAVKQVEVRETFCL